MDKITPFARSEKTKADKAAQLRARLAAATPATRPRPLQKLPLDRMRSLKAAVLILLLLAIWLAASGVFG